MKKPWFLTAALEGSECQERADALFKKESLEKKQFANFDVFFASNNEEREFLSHKIPPHVMIVDKEEPIELIEQKLYEFSGKDFLSRIGHDIINLISPLIDYQYLSEDIIKKRIDKGSLLGQQINIIGHILQKDMDTKEKSDSLDFISNFKALARKSGIEVEITESGESGHFEMPTEKIMFSVVREIISNLTLHSAGENRVFIEKEQKTIVIMNRTTYEFTCEKPMAVLRRPFYRQGNNSGNGLGLFILSISSVLGGFKWHLSVENNCFYLYLFF